MRHALRSLPILLALAACGGPPGEPGLALTPEAPTTSDDLVLQISDDPEARPNDEIAYEIAWFRGAAEVAELAGATTVPASSTTKGETWKAVVTAVDRKERTSLTTEVATTVLNTPPTITSVTFDNPTPGTRDDVVVTATGEDVDGDAITYRYTWLNDGAATSINGNAVRSNATRRGQVWTVQVTPDDGEDVGETVEATITIANTTPVAETVTLLPEIARTETNLRANATGSDEDGDALTWTYTWSVNDTPTAETGPILDSGSFVRGDVVRVDATPNDGVDDGAPISASIAIQNTPPQATSASIDQTSAVEGDSLTCTAGGWHDPDGDPAAYRIAWAVNGVRVSTDATLTSVWFDKDDSVNCVVIPWDGEDEGPAVTSAALIIGNTLPSAPVVEITPDPADEGNDLQCVVTTEATDIDADTLTYEFDWYVDGTLFTGSATKTDYAGDTIDGADTTEGEEWYCVATAWDGDGYGPDATSASVTIEAATYPTVGLTGTYGVISGSGWKVCRADASSAWVAANSSGTYNAHSICQQWGYSGATSQGGTCGTVCGYCGTSGREYYDGGGGSLSSIRYTVHWKCE